MSTMTQSWQPTRDETQPTTIQGYVHSIQNFEGKYGAYNIYRLTPVQNAEDAEWAIHAFHSDLKKRLVDLEVAPGDQLKVTFKGREDIEGTDKSKFVYEVSHKAAVKTDDPF